MFSAAAAALTPTKVRPVVKVAAKTGVASVGRSAADAVDEQGKILVQAWEREREGKGEKESGKLLQSSATITMEIALAQIWVILKSKIYICLKLCSI